MCPPDRPARSPLDLARRRRDRIHGLDWGQARAPRLVLMLHGVGGNAWIWRPVATRLRARLGPGVRVVAVDGRDGGLTDHPSSGYEGGAQRSWPFASREDALAWARRGDASADWNDARTRSFLAGLVERDDGTMVGRLPVDAVSALRQAREDTDSVGPRLAEIECPTLLLVAEHQSSKRKHDKLAYADGLRDVRVVAIDGSHFLHTDAPGMVADEIGSFLDDGWA